MNYRIASLTYRLALLRNLALALGLLFAGTAPAAADQIKLGDLVLDHPWARATPGQAKNGAAFVVIHNHGKTADRLISASSGSATRIELHNHVNKDGVMQMRQVEAVEVPAGGMAELKPGSFHVMLMGLKAPLKEGDSFALTMTFERAGSTTVDVKVEGVGSMGPMDMGSESGDMKQMDHGSMQHGHGNSSTTN